MTDTLIDQLLAEPTLDDIRNFHRKFVTGVTIVTTMDGDEPRGLALNAFSSVTLDPAMVLVCVAKSSSTHDALFSASHFAVNLLSREQLAVAKRFATKSSDKFAGLDWHEGPTGCPIIDDSCAHLEAEISMRVRTSTHTVFFGRVVHARSSDVDPLVYLGSAFFDGARLEPLTT
ncbi:MAG: CaiB/BaiF family protein [Nocardioides sp.]|jgi:flavin reductase (DIM6/NTAB) family NADH-FMN oxidoreductase RutF|nr:CaiB/BaiF family protein [Nocardioides sp.]